jgi:hypothetical protein
MDRRIGGVLAGAAVVAAVGLTLALIHDSSEPPTTATRAQPAASVPPSLTTRLGCAMRSGADFPGAYSDPGNLVAGPLAMIGAGDVTSAQTVHEFGGNKFPLIVKAGHVVTVQVAAAGRDRARLAYGSFPDGKRGIDDAFQRVAFKACPPGRPSRRYEANGPSGNHADGAPITFWSGFVLVREPMCVPLEVFVDGARSPRRVGIALGRWCGAQGATAGRAAS